MPKKIIILSVAFGVIWVIITVFNTFGWIQEGFYGGYGVQAYFFYGLLIPVVSGIVGAVMAREHRVRLSFLAFGMTLATLIIGFVLIYLSNKVKEQKLMNEDVQYEAEFQRELEKANAYRKQNNIQ